MCGARLTSFTPRVEDFSDRMSAGTGVFLLFRYGDGDVCRKASGSGGMCRRGRVTAAFAAAF
jgi:hypothetical protein